MYQIDDINAASSVPAPPTDDIGTPGFFQGSNAAIGQKATRLRFWWFNCVQQALIGLLVGAGVAQSKTDFTVVPQAVAIIGRRQQLFTASGTFTVPAGVYRIYVRLWGAGGGGGGTSGGSTTGGGAGGGAYSEGYLAVTPGQVITITIGAGGMGGQSGNPGTDGGGSSVGTAFVAGGGHTGGGTSSSGTSGTGGASGAPTAGTIQLQATAGGGPGYPAGSTYVGGNGGGSPQGGHPLGPNVSSSSVAIAGGAGNFPGGGANGGISGGGGGNGAGGYAIVGY